MYFNTEDKVSFSLTTFSSK